jgi:hypothetical protein
MPGAERGYAVSTASAGAFSSGATRMCSSRVVIEATSAGDFWRTGALGKRNKLRCVDEAVALG